MRQRKDGSRIDRSGCRNGRAKLIERRVAQIRLRLALGESGSAIAAEFGVSKQTVCCIRKGRVWPNVKAATERTAQ
jgi:DNA-binding XRE family transcriptional regulator